MSRVSERQEMTKAKTDASASPGGRSQVLVLMPVYNDWESAAQVIGDIDRLSRDWDGGVKVLIVDDASSVPATPLLGDNDFKNLDSVQVLPLTRNLGHQRAIAIGLTYVHQNIQCDVAVVMDADGEDRPEDVFRLLRAVNDHHGDVVVFAERSRRTDSLFFKLNYFLYKKIHWILTGRQVRVGNFSALSSSLLSALVTAPELWSHYAATVYKLRLPSTMIPTPRGKRIAGRSHMDFPQLVVHGLSAIAVFGETVGARVLVASVGFCCVSLFGLFAVVFVRLFTRMAVPGWATFTGLLLLILSSQILSFSASVLIHVLSSRATATFLPIRDYAFYIKEVEEIACGGG